MAKIPRNMRRAVVKGASHALTRLTGSGVCRSTLNELARIALDAAESDYDPDKHTGGWVFRYVRNHCIDDLVRYGMYKRQPPRKTERPKILSVPSMDHFARRDMEGRAYEILWRREVVENAMATLTPRERVVMTLHSEGLIGREIAERVVATESTVWTVLQSALAKLATIGQRLVREGVTPE